jgi:uncharacterized membrane protein YhaH (DUF805 family)
MGLASLSDGQAMYAVKALAWWIGSVGVVKRLHDTGRTGWWLLWGACAMCVWAAALGLAIAFVVGFEALQPDGLGYLALLAALMIPALGATLWLHFAPGEPAMNRYGAIPAGIVSHFGGERRNDAVRPADL